MLPIPSLLLLRPLQEYPGGIISISQGFFNIDESLGGEVRFALTYYDLGHVGNMVNLIDPKGRVVETMHIQEEDGDVNTIFITLRDAMVSTKDIGREWLEKKAELEWQERRLER